MPSLKRNALFSIASAGLFFGAASAQAQEAEPEVQLEAEPEAQMEAQPDAQMEAQPEAQMEAQPEAQAEVQSETLVQSPTDKLAARGQEMARGDASFATLRRYENRLYVRGFDIGLAAAEGQTEDGPGKQAMRVSLPEPERAAFDHAVAFTLARNKYAALATKGAEIATLVPGLSDLRVKSSSPWYALGFDIATAIFGDPRLGAQGNTQTGPGSLGIRNSLSATGGRGFDAAVAYHFSQVYSRLPAPATGNVPQATQQAKDDLGTQTSN